MLNYERARTKGHILQLFNCSETVKRMCGLETKIMTGGWRKLHNEELNIIHGEQLLLGLTVCTSEDSGVSDKHIASSLSQQPARGRSQTE
jgi:hypothetical protein